MKDKERRANKRYKMKENRKYPYKRNRNKKLLELNLKAIFLFLFTLYTLDYLSTVIALNLMSGFSEANPVHSYLFSLGLGGWIISFIITALVVYLLALIIEKGKNVIVKPKIIVQVEYEEIQESQSYSSGFALRFPRIKILREEISMGKRLCKVLQNLYEYYLRGN